MTKSFSARFSPLAVVCTLIACAPQIPAPRTPPALRSETRSYTGVNATEAILEFDHFVETKARTKPSPAQAQELVELQLTHLFGPMSFAQIPAVPKENHRISRLKVESASGGFIIRYHYTGTVSVGKKAGSTYTVILPRNPKTIYKHSTIEQRGREQYPCTDAHYNGPEDFWYFWNPDQPGCPLEEGRDYDRIDAALKVLPNTTRTYPEYERLVDAQGTIRIALFFGMDEETRGKNPNRSADENAENFLSVRQSLLHMGYASKKLTRPEIVSLLGFTPSPYPYIELLSKKSERATIVVRLVFGPTGIDEKSSAFHHLYKDSLENASVMIYDGHSGLGGHLDLRDIESAENFKIRPNTSRYQIYFFNSCSSYTYYNQTYFARKRTSSDPNGTKNLDILTNGLATLFSVMHDTNLALLRAIDAWAEGKRKTSYQELAAQIDSDNLFGVVGDEDNPTQ